MYFYSVERIFPCNEFQNKLYLSIVSPVGFDRRVRGLPGDPAFFLLNLYWEVLRTYIYVDGFNLYYGALENTPYKWLDLSSLFCQILNSNPSNLKIKYFTSRVSPRDDDLSKPQRQDVYLRALRTYCLNIEIYFGKFVTHPKRLPLADNIDQMVNVLRTEEKGSDVNLAVHLLNDAWLNKYDCGIVVSNDGDLSEAMRLVREERRIKLGLLTPGSSHRVRVSYQLR